MSADPVDTATLETPTEPPTQGEGDARPARAGRRGVAGSAVVPWILLVVGVAMIVAGAAGWVLVREQLADERITVSADAAHFAGERVDGPLSAYFQADTIRGHVLESTDGKTFAELDRSDPARETAMQGAGVRTPLMLSVLSFGVAGLVVVNGVVAVLVALALRRRA